jgi:hypothetical protein
VTGETLGGVGAVLSEELERARIAGEEGDAVILVEGVSDQLAVETLAERQGRDLSAEGIAVIPIAGATNIGRFVGLLGPAGYDVRLGGICDAAEEDEFRIALEVAEVGSGRLDRDEMEHLGFFVCESDLEDELIRALGSDRMIALIESQGQLRRFRSFQNQPAQRHKTIEQQLWRWLGNHKIRYAPLMVDALDIETVPRPLLMALTRPPSD